ncbi:acyl-CoA thioesterase [Streptomyces lydicus]|uniref:acyl-CoA thioesterase n=1 Tax=Streptomyces lydicus TaxID=47763 RepID=UPI0036E7644E
MSVPDTALLSDQYVTITHVTTARDTNIYGYVSGALTMKLIDDAALVLGVRVARGPAVTARVEQLEFLKPVEAGDVLHAYARLMKTGYSSIKIDVEVYAERIDFEIPILASRAQLTFVAVDETNRPRPISSSAARKAPAVVC